MSKKKSNIFSSPLGRATIFIGLMVVAITVLFVIFDKKEEIKGNVLGAASSPLEIVYKAPLSAVGTVSQAAQPPDSTSEAKVSDGNTWDSQNSPASPAPPHKSQEITLRGKSSSRQTENVNNTRTVPAYQTAVKPYTPPIALYTASPSTVAVDPDSISAPYGQLLRCELVLTVETSNLQTPIVALVTEPLWWNGVEIIPAGVIVHGTAASSGMRDRVGTGRNWVLTWPHRNDMNGKTLILNATALACDRTESTWSDTDGSAGIKGQIISNEDQKKLLAYIASFISGLGDGMVEESEDTTGSTTTKTTGGKFQDALGKALAKSAGDISSQLMKELAKNASYVKAQAGTEFYLYITQDIIINEAGKGKLIANVQQASTQSR